MASVFVLPYVWVSSRAHAFRCRFPICFGADIAFELDVWIIPVSASVFWMVGTLVRSPFVVVAGMRRERVAASHARNRAKCVASRCPEASRSE